MIVLTNSQMKEAEQKAMTDFNISSLILMENAALNVVNYIEENFNKKTKIAAVCGKGNNGGDGFAIARGLFSRGFQVSVFACGDMERATPDCKTNYEIVKSLGITFSDNLKEAVSKADITIDAVIGTGLTKTLRADTAEIVSCINAYSHYTIAVDCPTGINSDNGEVLGSAVKADLTYTFHAPKKGLLFYPAREYVGGLKVGSIGTPVLESENPPYINTLTDEEAAEMLPKRLSSSNKGTYGRVIAFSGCDEMTGAAVLNLKAAYKSGAGLACGIATEKCVDVIHTSLTEAVTKIAPNEKGFLTPEALEKAKPLLNEKAVITAGSGLGVTLSTKALIKALVNTIETTLIIDADGINCLADMREELKNSKANVILTPHIKEMSRLCGKTIKDIKAEPVGIALSFAEEYGVTVMLKDTVTVIASPKGKVTVNNAGTAAMSKGGTGDVLAGLTAGLSAQGLSPHNAAALAAYINGKAGELGEEEKGSYGLTASDLCGYIPKVMEKLK
ncbi:MAG: NAD(P)H-hydrate dehydratase [Clostridiales bacterium]|nr:NAD(P)H-hydrate dehydratase [Clostridiales bacterium]